MMKALSQWPGFLAGLMLAGSLGYLAGRRNPELPTAPDEPAKAMARSRASHSQEAFDSAGARSSLDREADPLKRQQAATEVMESWVANDPKAALAWLASQPKSGRIAEILNLALRQYAEADPRGAVEWAASNLKGRELHNQLILLSEIWASQDPAAAAAWVGKQAPDGPRDAALEGILFSWGGTDPQAAGRFLTDLKGDPQLLAALKNATFAGWAKSDPQGAAQASLAASQAAKDPRAFAITVANWATVDLAASSEWLLTQAPEGTEKTAAMGEIVQVFAQQSPEAGTRWLEKMPAGAEKSALTNNFAEAWASTDPASAAAWAATQAEGALSAESLDSIVANFLTGDQRAFEQWKNGLPAGKLRTLAEQALASPPASRSQRESE